jgi:arylsulfatase A
MKIPAPLKPLALSILISSSLAAGSIIQFGGDINVVSETNWQNAINASQVISWTGANSFGGGTGASGMIGGQGTGRSVGATLSSQFNELVMTSRAIVQTGTASPTTFSTGNPNVLGVMGDVGLNAKFEGQYDESYSFDFDKPVKLKHVVISALNGSSEIVELTVPSILSVSFTIGSPNVSQITWGPTPDNRYVYTFPAGGLQVPAGTDITLTAAAGEWGLQAVIVEVADTTPPVALDPLPNIVLFIADDMGIGDSSAYQDLTGNADEVQIYTPHMERLASYGTRFTDAHTNGATCTPSRISLLSGTYSFRSPMKIKAVQDTNHTHGVILPGRRLTLAHMLQRAGYRTYGYGKWHMALKGDKEGTGTLYEGPIECGFDTYTGTPGNFSYAGAMIQDKQYVRFDANDNLVPFNDPSAQPWVGQGPNFPTDPNLFKIQPAVFNQMEADLADHMAAHADQPLFVYYASHSNHDPYVPAPSINGVVIDTNVTVAGGMIDIPTIPDADGDGIPEPDPNTPGWIWGSSSADKWWDHVIEFDNEGNIINNGPTNRAMMVRENDIIIGALLDFLQETDDPRNPGKKMIENTLFMFTSDNGADIRSEAAVGALPQSSDSAITDITGFKGTRWEGGNRVPFLAAWPQLGIAPGTTSSAIFGLNDVYATIAEAVGHSLASDEAVDSESLLTAWRDGIGGTVRQTDLLYKYWQRLFSRRGEFKLAAIDGDYTGASDDRFANNNNLDFDDMVFDDLFNLANDLDEQTDLGNTTDAQDMLNAMNQMTSQGYSRSGAAPFENGVNFEGGNLLTANNWHAYKTSRNNQLPTATTPGFICIDGTASGDLSSLLLMHRAATLAYSPGTAGGLVNSQYEIDGGTLQTDAALRLDNSRLSIYRGAAALGAHPLELNGGTCTVTIAGGTLTTSKVSLGEAAGSTAGEKVIRFIGGEGTLELTAVDPVGFGDDGSTSNDYIDFTTGALGRLLSTQNAAYFASLWDNGQLRIDGQVGTVGQFASSGFKVVELGDGRRALVLEGDKLLDFDGDTISDTWEQEKAGGMNLLSLSGDYDKDTIKDVDEFTLDYDPTTMDPPFTAAISWDSLNGELDISFPSKGTRNYVIKHSSAIDSPDWETLNTEVGNDGQFIYNHDTEDESSFYAVEVFVP